MIMKNLAVRNNFSLANSIFEDFFSDDFFQRKNTPAVNVKENEKEFSIELAAPGYKKDSFNIEIKDEYLKISSKNESNSTSKDDKFYRREFTYSSFERSFYLPENVNVEEIKASYNEGILFVSIPKKAKIENKPKLIEVQ